MQPIDTRDGATRWAERYERAVDAPFGVQDEVARQIVSQHVYAQSWLGEFDAGLAGLRRAPALNPNDPDSMRNLPEALGRSGEHRASIAAAQLGRADEARVAMQRYRALDPGATTARLTASPRLHRHADRGRMTALLLAAGLPS